jgi:hypothetical protein
MSPEFILTFPVERRGIFLDNLGNPLVQAVLIPAIALAPSTYRVTEGPGVLAKFLCLKGNEKSESSE